MVDDHTPIWHLCPMRSSPRPHASTPSTHLEIGKKGERIGIEYLERLGYKVLDANVRVGRHDEIDILAYDPTDQALVFVEVKSRARGGTTYTPDINVTWKKRYHNSRAARRWVGDHDYDGGYRLDVLCVSQGRVTDHYIEVGVR